LLILAAILEPVHLDGVMIERASLHNENEVNRLGLGLVDTSISNGSDDSAVLVFVRVKRAGEVIPKIIGIDSISYGACSSSSVDDSTCRSSSADDSSGGHKYRLPDVCPVCGSQTERVVSGAAAPVDEDEEAEPAPVTVRCTGGGTVCSAQAVEQIR